jgi:hypothetical protein
MCASQRLDTHVRVPGTVMIENHVAWVNGIGISLRLPDLDP